MKPSFFKPHFSPYRPSPAGGAGPSERTASPEPGRAGSTDKSDKPKSRFDTPLSPSRLASGFNRLFGKKDEAKEQLKQTAKEILDLVEKHLGGKLDEATKKELNSSLRKTLTASEIGMLAHTLHGVGVNKTRLGSTASHLSAMTKDLASGKLNKNLFMSALNNASQKLDNLEAERATARQASEAVKATLKSLYGLLHKLGKEEFGDASCEYDVIMTIQSYPERTEKLKNLDARLQSVIENLRTPLEKAERAALAQLEDLGKSPKNRLVYELAKEKYQSVLTLASPADRQAKLEEFAGVLKYANDELKKHPSLNFHDYVASFDPFPSRESRHQPPPRSDPPPRRPKSGSSSQRPESGPSSRRRQSARPEPQAMPKPASAAHPASAANAKPAYWTAPVAYAGPKIAVGGIRPAEAREQAEILKQHLGSDQLKELHGDLLALANTATDDMKNAFDEKYKKVFANKYDGNPAAFAVLGKVGLSGCGGDAKQSRFWSLASAHAPRN